MAAPTSVWGIDIGQCALKALKLREVEGHLQIEAFDIIEHEQLLSAPGADRPQLLRRSLEQFLSRNDLTNCRIVVSVPGQTSFSRFVKMPPVDIRKIPDLVRFEAEQQIPFNINEVVWRWQSFPDPDSPDIEVGLFAIKRTDVYSVLDPFREMLVDVDAVQMAPLALYNFMTYDQQIAADGATLLLDIGAETTDLVVADGPRLWTRTIQLGGSNFTEALVKAFKLSFDKAEKLKRSAATSKYARQVFQAMRPVFSDLVQEIQRSIGYYTSLHRQTRFTRILGLGNGFRLPGMQKFLGQNLNAEVVRVDLYNAPQPSPMISMPQFTENVLGFAVAYGLGLQGLELANINTSLLPNEIASARRWFKKRLWFAAAAALLIVASLSLAGRVYKDKSQLKREPEERIRANRILEEYSRLQEQYNRVRNQGDAENRQAEQLLKVQGYRSFWPDLLAVLSESILAAAPNQQLMVEGNVEQLRKIPPTQQKYLDIKSLKTDFIPDLSAPGAKVLISVGSGQGAGATPGVGGAMPMGGSPGGFGGGGMAYPGGGGMAYPGGGAAQVTGPATAGGERGFRVTLTGRCPMNKDATTTLLGILREKSKQLVEDRFKGEMEIVNVGFIRWLEPGSISGGSPGMERLRPLSGQSALPGGMPMPNMPASPGFLQRPPGSAGTGTSQQQEEDLGPKDITGRPIADDIEFEFAWVIKVVGDGLAAPAKPEGQQTGR
ncbi:MAG: pilus assembly protein PilM [Planctomycetes bacterium]|nr:pilus assembly protein PilM [Planctomycetota bacterium]